MRHFALSSLIIALALAGATPTQAQELDDDLDGLGLDEGAPAMQPTEEATEPPHPERDTSGNSSDDGADGSRFRFGVSAGIGFFSAEPEGAGQGASFTYGGMDLRLGMQINDLVGVYAQPTLGYYSTGDAGPLAIGGLLGLAVVADVTLIDRFFAGAGVGYTIYNNPSGLTPLLRIGAYPLMTRSKTKVRRKGLMVGMDLRFTKLEGLSTIIMPTFNIGYEAF